MRSKLIRVLTVASLMLYALAIAEICVRVVKPQALMPRYVTATPWGVRGNVPHAVYRHKTQEVDVEYRINGQGMRMDHEASFAKPANTCRIALFGDSFFVGYELDLRDTLATEIEQQMRRDGFNVEVLNFGVSGFGTAEMLVTYENYAYKFAPDLLIFEWHSTDFADNLRSNLYELKDGRLAATGRTYLPSMSIQDALMKSRLYRAIADHSHLYAWVRERAAGMIKKQLLNLQRLRVRRGAAQAATPAAAEPDAASPPGSKYSNRLSAELLRYAHTVSTASGRSFMVVDIPDQQSPTLFKSTWSQLAQDVVGDIDLVEGADVFNAIASPTTKLSYETGHGHITPLAARALAHAVVRRIETPGTPQARQIQSCRSERQAGEPRA